MQCRDVQATLEAYVDKSLNRGQATGLKRHLAGCESCQAELAYLQAVEKALDTWPLVAEPDDLTARVMAQVKPHPELRRFRIRWSDLAIGLAGAVLATTTPLLWRLLAPGIPLRLTGNRQERFRTGSRVRGKDRSSLEPADRRPARPD